MIPELIGAIAIIGMLVLMYFRMWVGLCMLFCGFAGIVAIAGWHSGLTVLGTVPYRSIASYTIAVVPLFVFMGVLVGNTGMASGLFYTAYKWIGRQRGGLAIATVVACAVFAAVVSVSTVCTVTMSKIALPEMKKYKYGDILASGCIVAGSTIGILIPPSMPFVLYAILTQTSVGALFMAGVIPGILQAVLYITTIIILCRFNPNLGPMGPTSTFKEKVQSLKGSWATLALILLVLGGIYKGIFTPTEAGAVGAFFAIVITLVARRLTYQNFLSSILDTAQNTAMMILLMSGAFVFQYLMNFSQLPYILSQFVAELHVSMYFVLIIIVVLYIILGMFMDIMSTIILTIPILFPITSAIGIDPIWFGVIVIKVIQMGLITPPVGMDVFMLAGVSGLPISTIFKGVVPFIAADLVHLTLLIAFPALSLFLSSGLA